MVEKSLEIFVYSIFEYETNLNRDYFEKFDDLEKLIFLIYGFLNTDINGLRLEVDRL